MMRDHGQDPADQGRSGAAGRCCVSVLLAVVLVGLVVWERDQHARSWDGAPTYDETELLREMVEQLEQVQLPKGLGAPWRPHRALLLTRRQPWPEGTRGEEADGETEAVKGATPPPPAQEARGGEGGKLRGASRPAGGAAVLWRSWGWQGEREASGDERRGMQLGLEPPPPPGPGMTAGGVFGQHDLSARPEPVMGSDNRQETPPEEEEEEDGGWGGRTAFLEERRGLQLLGEAAISRNPLANFSTAGLRIAPPYGEFSDCYYAPICVTITLEYGLAQRCRLRRVCRICVSRSKGPATEAPPPGGARACAFFPITGNPGGVAAATPLTPAVPSD